MGLLDSVLGSVLAGQNQQGGLGGLGNVLGGMLGGQQQAPQGQAGGLNAGLIAALAPVLIGMLANNGGQGGLGGLLDKFTRAGAGDAANSWIGTGQNPGNNDDTSAATDAENRLGSFLGAMAQAANDSPEVTPKAGDRATAASLGRRVASAAARWRAGAREAFAAA